ncbi:MAG: hypothetical protein WD646_03980 [Actinomycetota bacterium]
MIPRRLLGSVALLTLATVACQGGPSTSGDGVVDSPSVEETSPEAGATSPAGPAASLGVTPEEFRVRWNDALDELAPQGQADYLRIAQWPVSDRETVSVDLASGVTVTGRAGPHGTFEQLTVRLDEGEPGPLAPNAATRALIPRLLATATLPSNPLPTDPAVVELANELSTLHAADRSGAAGSLSREGLRFSLAKQSDVWTYMVRPMLRRDL